jgi:hypothetical protein
MSFGQEAFILIFLLVIKILIVIKMCMKHPNTSNKSEVQSIIMPFKMKGVKYLQIQHVEGS